MLPRQVCGATTAGARPFPASASAFSPLPPGQHPAFISPCGGLMFYHPGSRSRLVTSEPKSASKHLGLSPAWRSEFSWDQDLSVILPLVSLGAGGVHRPEVS